MEYIDGAPLSMVMQRERRVSWERALDIAGQIADALASAHEAHIIHRDIKPGNILLDESSHVYVTDFGIAKILTAETQLTADGSLLGTPQYMAPERCQNGEATAASDIYSLGILTFQMISGRLPFEASTPVDLVRKIVSQPPERLRNLAKDVPEDVERLVAFMMEKKPKDRPSSARALCEAIARVRSGEPLDTHGSEVAAALASFRDAMATPTPRPGPLYVNSATTEERLAQRSSGTDRARESKWRKRRLILGGVGLAMVVGIGVAAWFTIANRTRLTADANPARGVELWQASGAVAEFVDEAPGVLLARLELGGFAVDAVGACGGPSTVVQLAGARDGARAGEYALVFADPAHRSASLELAPISAAGSGARESIRLLAGVGATQSDGALGHGVILGYESSGTKGAQASCGLALWDVQSHAPHYPLFQVAAPSGGHGAITAAAVKPDGATVALGVAAADGSCYLAERDVRAKDCTALGPALSERGAPIVFIAYSADGAQIGFVRDLGNHRRQVWVATASAPGGACRKLADGSVNVGPNAFSPDGATLAITEEKVGGRSVAQLVNVKDGTTQTELGEGWSAGWGRSGERVVVTAPDSKGRIQFWSLAASAATNRTQLTYLDAGVGRAFCVSADGAWAVGSLANTPQATLVFVDLTKAAS
jgi:hypothetical protein